MSGKGPPSVRDRDEFFAAFCLPAKYTEIEMNTAAY